MHLIDRITPDLSFFTAEYRPLVFTAFTATTLAVGAVLTRWESVRIIGMTVLTGVAYGIVNDMFACRDCIEYFTVGHFYDGRNLDHRPLQTLDPTLNALAWGMIATWHVCALAGVILAAIARLPLPGLTMKINASQLAPMNAIGAALALLLAHLNSRRARQAMIDNPSYKYMVPQDFQAGWEACNVRNLTGYFAIAIGGLILSIGIIAARVLLSRKV